MTFNIGKLYENNQDVIKNINDVLIIGDAGSGKTTKIKNFIKQIPKEDNIFIVSEYNEYNDFNFQYYNVDFFNFDLFTFYKCDLYKFNNVNDCIDYFNYIILNFCNSLTQVRVPSEMKIYSFVKNNYNGTKDVDIFTFYDWLLRNHAGDICLHSIFLKIKTIIQNKSLINEYIDINKPVIFTPQNLSDKKIFLFNILSKIYSLIYDKNSWIIIDCVVSENLEMFFELKRFFNNKNIHFIISAMSKDIFRYFSEKTLEEIDYIDILKISGAAKNYIKSLFNIKDFSDEYNIVSYNKELLKIKKGFS